jgi:hypothetical protein
VSWLRCRLAVLPAKLVLGAVVLVAATVSPVQAPRAAPAVVSRPHPAQSRPVADPHRGRTSLTVIAGARQPLAPIVMRSSSARDPLRVWIIGDSVMFDGSLGITAALEATGRAKVVANSSFGGWGLGTDRAWPRDAENIIAKYRPEVVIGTWSWDNRLAAADPAAYTRRLRAALAQLLAPGNGVGLVTLLEYPQTGPPTVNSGAARRTPTWAALTARQLAWDDAAEQALQAFPAHTRYLRTATSFAPAGKYRAWQRTATSGWKRIRKTDEVHLCPYGAALLGALVIAELAPTLHLGPAAPGWQSGPWTDDPRYNDPPGACRPGQPPPGYTDLTIPQPR